MTTARESSARQVLQVGPLKPSLAETLRTSYDALALPDGDERDAFLSEHADRVHVVVTSGRTGVGTELMGRLPNLRVVINFGVGYDTTDTTLASTRGIGVSNTPDVLTDCVADTALGLLIDVMRGLSAADRFVRAGTWPTRGSVPLTRQVSHKRVGIVGLGRIGQAIATRLQGFGCDISYHSRREVAGSTYAYVPSLVDLAKQVDALVVAVPGGASTEGLVGREVLEALGPGGYLVNIARGSVVDEKAMVELLTSGQLGGAGLDVFVDEPHVPAELLALDNVVLLPHLGSGTVETRAAMEALTLRNLDQFLTDGTLATPVC